MDAAELVALVCCDLGSIVRGRSVLAAELDEHRRRGVGWVPANQALTPLGPVAEPNPFGSTGDLRLLPDVSTRARVEGEGDAGALELVLCDIVELDGRPWECCPREFLRESLRALEKDTGAHVWASFEHEFQLLSDEPAALPFSLDAQRRVEPFPARLMGALVEAGLQPERFFAEYAPHQFEVPVAASAGPLSADRSVVLREVVREVARRHGMRASFVPLLDPEQAGNGVHIHLDLRDAEGRPLLYDPARPGGLSELGGRFAAGVLAHAPALSALTAASPVSGARLTPHRWSAGAACLGQRNREALLRIPPVVEFPLRGRIAIGDGRGDVGAAEQLHLEYRGADAAGNPYLALGAIVRAGIEGIRAELPAPAMLERDPAELSAEEAERFGVGALPTTLAQALSALAADATVRGWMGPLLYEAYVAVKRAELAAADGADLAELCRRYAAIY